MRNFKVISAMFIVLILPTLVQAGTLENITGVADCNSWSADLTLSFSAQTIMSRVEYAVVVQDAAGTEIDRFDYADFIDIPATPTAVFTFGGTWHVPLDGRYTVTGDFTVYDIFGEAYNLTYGSFATDLACGSGGSTEPVCLHSASYWSRHPDLWPVTSLELRGQMFDQADLMRMLGKFRRHQPYFHRIQRLVRQLVAAKLNLANGGSDDIQPIVTKADLFLTDQLTRHRSGGHLRSRGGRLARVLRRYNRRGCDSSDAKGFAEDTDTDFAESGNKAAVEVMSLGTIKAMYQ